MNKLDFLKPLFEHVFEPNHLFIQLKTLRYAPKFLNEKYARRAAKHGFIIIDDLGEYQLTFKGLWFMFVINKQHIDPQSQLSLLSNKNMILLKE